MKITSILFLLIGNLYFTQNVISLTHKNINRGIIYKNDKTQIEGKITTPLSAYQKKIKIRDNGKNLSIKSIEIDSIIYNENVNTTLIFTPTEYFAKRKSNDKKTQKHQWLKKNIKGKLSLYETTYIEHRKEHNKSITLYFLKRKSENFPTLIGTKINEPFPQSGERDFRNNIEKYFSDEPNFLNLIKEKEYSLDEISLICKEYNQ